MKEYLNKISLSKNSRGVYDLDPFKGCSNGMGLNDKGCYGICYAAKIAKFRGYDFSKTVKRDFIDDKHLQKIGKKLSKIKFIRLGVSCDPSFDWEHTINIIEKIRPFNKNIVIITKHWTNLTYKQCVRLKGVTVNTSISALDSELQLDNRMFWYNKLKEFCNSVLRVNTADFNDIKLKELQDKLLNNDKVIDNILRFSIGHDLASNSIINVKKHKFLGTEVYASKHKEDTYFGFCKDCKDQCGIDI
jgi:hypothetical protein